MWEKITQNKIGNSMAEFSENGSARETIKNTASNLASLDLNTDAFEQSTRKAHTRIPEAYSGALSLLKGKDGQHVLKAIIDPKANRIVQNICLHTERADTPKKYYLAADKLIKASGYDSKREGLITIGITFAGVVAVGTSSSLFGFAPPANGVFMAAMTVVGIAGLIKLKFTLQDEFQKTWAKVKEVMQQPSVTEIIFPAYERVAAQTLNNGPIRAKTVVKEIIRPFAGE